MREGPSRREKKKRIKHETARRSTRTRTHHTILRLVLSSIFLCSILELSRPERLVDAFTPTRSIATKCFLHQKSTSTSSSGTHILENSQRRRRNINQNVVDHHYRRRSTRVFKSSSVDDEGEEWRAFRARLVQKGLPLIPTDDKNNIGGDDENDGMTQEKKISNGNINESDSEENSNDDTCTSTTIRYAHECTPLVEVGTVLVSIPTTDLCQALEQQYWHRAVVLVTEVAEDVKRGYEETTVPDDQLALGANRGRWSYRGILLNRFTDLVFDDETGEQQERCTSNHNHNRGWNIHRGGDLLGLNSADGETEFICLHHLGWTDPNVRKVSTRLVGDLSFISLADAQLLCDGEKYSPDDFYVYGGFCSWRPGQLELEMGDGREEWRAISVDNHSILQQIQQQMNEAKIVMKSSDSDGVADAIVSQGLLDGGSTMWRNFLSMIDVPEGKATERLPVGQLDFYDRMLEVWSEDNLLFHGGGEDTKVIGDIDSSDLIGPGTLLRAKLPVSHDMLMYEQEFIRSLILVLEESEDATVGIMLNHPLQGAVECVEGKRPLPLRYGGPIDISSWKDGTFLDSDEEEDMLVDGGDDEIYEGFMDYQNGIETDLMMNDDINFDDYDDGDDDDDSMFLWIHRDVALGSRGPENGGGTRLGTSDVWLIKENDALKSLQSGFLSLQDTMVFSGVCIWEKKQDLGVCGGGMREQVDALQSFEIVQKCNEDACDPDVDGDNDNHDGFDFSDHEVIEKAWDILGNYQNILEKETLEGNIKAAIDAWESCNVSVSKSKNADLSDAALRAWVGVNLLMDPLGTFVEVTSRNRAAKQ